MSGALVVACEGHTIDLATHMQSPDNRVQLCLPTQSPIRTHAHTNQATSANTHSHIEPHTSREVVADAIVVRRAAQSTPSPALTPITDTHVSHAHTHHLHHASPCCCNPGMQLCIQEGTNKAPQGVCACRHTHAPSCTKQHLCCLLHKHYSKLQHWAQHPAAEGLIDPPLLARPTHEFQASHRHTHATTAANKLKHLTVSRQATDHAPCQALLPKNSAVASPWEPGFKS
jgi:hypothetical protein